MSSQKINLLYGQRGKEVKIYKIISWYRGNSFVPQRIEGAPELIPPDMRSKGTYLFYVLYTLRIQKGESRISRVHHLNSKCKLLQRRRSNSSSSSDVNSRVTFSTTLILDYIAKRDFISFVRGRLLTSCPVCSPTSGTQGALGFPVATGCYS